MNANVNILNKTKIACSPAEHLRSDSGATLTLWLGDWTIVLCDVSAQGLKTQHIMLMFTMLMAHFRWIKL